MNILYYFKYTYVKNSNVLNDVCELIINHTFNYAIRKLKI